MCVWVEAPNQSSDGCSSRLDCLGSSVDGRRPLSHFTSMAPLSVWLMARNLVSRRQTASNHWALDAVHKPIYFSNKTRSAYRCILARHASGLGCAIATLPRAGWSLARRMLIKGTSAQIWGRFIQDDAEYPYMSDCLLAGRTRPTQKLKQQLHKLWWLREARNRSDQSKPVALRLRHP